LPFGQYAVSCYAPTFGNVEARWYSDEKFDTAWTPECDALLEEYSERYAPFLLAYIPRYQKEVLTRLKIKLSSQNIDYAILTKAANNPKILKKWKSSHSELEGVVRECLFCAVDFDLLDTHPNVIRNCGTEVRWCRGCNYSFWRYASVWSEDLEARVRLPLPESVCQRLSRVLRQVLPSSQDLGALGDSDRHPPTRRDDRKGADAGF
jgi:hypothetical protein